MNIPAQDRSLDHLHPLFRRPLQAWLADLAARGMHVQIYETYRTVERQLYLYSLGRTVRNPNTPAGRAGLGPIVTYTTDSLHRYGAACDLMPVEGGRATFDLAAYQRLYAAIPLSRYGLETLDFERPHVQLQGGQGTCHHLGIQRDVMVGSVWPDPARPAAAPAPGQKLTDPTVPRVTLVDMAGRDVQLLDDRAVFGGVLIERTAAGVRLTRQSK